MNNMFKSVLGIPDPSMIEKSGGKYLLDPIGTSNPSLRPYTDPLNLIYKGSTVDYNTGKTYQQVAEEEQKQKDYNQAKLDFARSMGYKKGGAVKSKKASSASKRGDGIAQRGKTRGKMV